ncbi:MAG TPA: MBL fold metallo-hydrolase [Pirellulales bacterium]|nr:MBL fold metallo-hydrolase [Pirellulales bacterium]
MRQLAANVWQLGGFPPNVFNVYLIGDVLIDAATRWSGRRILRELGERKLSLLALTHVHPDHQGAAKMICERYAVPLACHADDIPTMEGRRPMQPDSFPVRLSSRLWSGPAYPVARALHEGDELAGFRVFHAPGHTPGHIFLFRDEDRVAIVGDVLNGMNLATTWPGLHEPPALACTDAGENRRSIFRLAELQPRLLCFGHGPPLRDMTKFERFLERLDDGET